MRARNRPERYASAIPFLAYAGVAAARARRFCRRARIGVEREPAANLMPGRTLVKVDQVPRIVGALLFQPTPHMDERGFFSRTFDADVMRAAGIDPVGFAQDSLSRSRRGVVRGLHVRRGLGEAKLVRCSYGAIFDVIVDLGRLRQRTATGKVSSCVTMSRCRSMSRSAAHMVFRPSGPRRRLLPDRSPTRPI